jgi:hypothetical protein
MVVDTGVRGAIYHTALGRKPSSVAALAAPLVNLQIGLLTFFTPPAPR